MRKERMRKATGAGSVAYRPVDEPQLDGPTE
jgi:hypothetical protein